MKLTITFPLNTFKGLNLWIIPLVCC